MQSPPLLDHSRYTIRATITKYIVGNSLLSFKLFLAENLGIINLTPISLPVSLKKLTYPLCFKVLKYYKLK